MSELPPPPTGSAGPPSPSTSPPASPAAAAPATSPSTLAGAPATTSPSTLPGAPASPAAPYPTSTPAPLPFVGAQAGDLTGTWRMLLAAGWLAAGFAYAAVWQASVQIGIATWWVGPRSEPTPAAVRLIPFAVVLLVVFAVLYNVRGLLWISFATAGATVLIALPDFSRSVGLAVTELVISLSLLVLSAAASTGRYRAVPAAARAATVPPDPHGPPSGDI